MRTIKEFSKQQINKWERQQREKQKKLKRGKFTKVKAKKLSKDAGVDLYYMDENLPIRIVGRMPK